jgi:hypothetical protein
VPVVVDRTDQLAAVPLVATAPPPEPRPTAAAPGRLAVSLKHRINAGTLTVLVDGRALLVGDFSKRKLDPLKVSQWDPFQLAAGEHEIQARVDGGKGKAYTSPPHRLRVAAGATAPLKLVLRDGALELD